MHRYTIIFVAAITVLTSGIMIGCAPDLPKEVNDATFTSGYEDGYSLGYSLTVEDSHRKDLFWTPPDKVEEAQKFNPKINIRDFYIPKGYLTMNDVASLHFPDGTPFNEKQKEQWAEAYNWGFYSGFRKGCDDYIKGKPSHTELLNPIP